MKKFKFNS